MLAISHLSLCLSSLIQSSSILLPSFYCHLLISYPTQPFDRSLELARAGRPWGRPPRTDPSTSTTGPSPASTIGHEGLNLKDTWSRVYLARGCASVIQSGHIAGDIGGRGEVYWQSLLLLSLSDPSDLVAMEAIKAMFGAPLPKAEPSIRRRGQGQVDNESEAMQARIFGASWNMIMSVADDAVPHETVPGESCCQS